MTPDKLYFKADAKTPESVDELPQVKSELEGPLSKAFTNSMLTSNHEACLRFEPPGLCLVNVRAWSLHRCGSNVSLAPDTRPIDRAPYRANPRDKAVIDKCVHDMLQWDITEERPSPWGSPCTLVPNKNGSPRFCDYRHIARKSWPLPNPDSCQDVVGGVKFISTADVLSAFW